MDSRRMWMSTPQRAFSLYQQAKAHTPEIGTVIDDAMRAIEKENNV